MIIGGGMVYTFIKVFSDMEVNCIICYKYNFSILLMLIVILSGNCYLFIVIFFCVWEGINGRIGKLWYFILKGLFV